MFRLILRWLITAFAILMVPYLVNGVIVDDFGAALACAIVLSLLNLIVKPILVFLTFPFTLLSLGLFLFVINAIIFYWAGALVNGIHVASFGAAFLASLIVSLVSWLVQVSSGGSKVVVMRNGPRRKIIDVN